MAAASTRCWSRWKARTGARPRRRRPHRIRPAEVPQPQRRPRRLVAHERQTLETISRNEGKPEAALPKIIEGRLNGFFKDVALLDQPYAKDDKQTITQLIGSATIVRFAQVEIG